MSHQPLSPSQAKFDPSKPSWTSPPSSLSPSQAKFDSNNPYYTSPYYNPTTGQHSSNYADYWPDKPQRANEDSDTDDEPIVYEKPQELSPPEVVQVEQRRLATRNKKLLYGGLGAIGLLTFLIGVIFVLKKLRAKRSIADEEQHVPQYIPEKAPPTGLHPSYQQPQTGPEYHGPTQGASEKASKLEEPQQLGEKASALSYGSQVRLGKN